MRTALLACGPVSSLLYVVAIDVVAPLRHRRYHHYTSQLVSELAAEGAPTRRLQSWLSVPYTLLVCGFVAGVWRSAGQRRAVRLTAAGLGGYAFLSSTGTFFAPMDVRGTPEAERSSRHGVVVAAMAACSLVAIVSGAFVRGAGFRRYSLATAAVFVASAGATAILARPLPRRTPGAGLAERINVYTSMLWIGVLAAALWRPTRGASD